MNPRKLPEKRGPEYYVREKIVKMLTRHGWIVKLIHGSMYQSGLPDIYATHKRHGPRWIEVKLPNMDGSRWTKAQLENFPLLSENGTGIWVLTADTDHEYKKLFDKPNWFEYFIMKF